MQDDRDYIWLGDLAGFELQANGNRLELWHRCCWREEVQPADAFLGNIVDHARLIRRGHDCALWRDHREPATFEPGDVRPALLRVLDEQGVPVLEKMIELVWGQTYTVEFRPAEDTESGREAEGDLGHAQARRCAFETPRYPDESIPS